MRGGHDLNVAALRERGDVSPQWLALHAQLSSDEVDHPGFSARSCQSQYQAVKSRLVGYVGDQVIHEQGHFSRAHGNFQNTF
jgi:hypothetical protein